MFERNFDYAVGDKNCKGFLAYKGDEKRPGVVIAPAWRGLDEFAKQKARDLANLGYVALVADIYGEGAHATSNEKAAELMAPFFVNRKLLQERILGAFEALRAVQNVDKNKMGAIGFCFGGLTVIELLRSGADLRGVVSFHGVLGNQMGSMKAVTVPIAKNVKGSLLVLHGNSDPLVSLEDILNLQSEMDHANVDWQMNLYGHTKHAFTNPEARDDQSGLVYNEKIARRAWQSMINFFEEKFL